MHAYAVVAAFDPNFTDHDWAVANIKKAGLADDFSTVWPNAARDHDLEESSPTYWMDIFRSRMEKKRPNELGGDD